METTCRESKYESHRVVLGVLLLATVLVPAYYAATALLSAGQHFRLSLLLMAVTGYVIHHSLPWFQVYYQHRGYRGYFTISIFLVALVIYAGERTRICWIMALPIASQAMMHLPLRFAVRVIVPLVIISFFPFWPFYINQAVGIGFSFGVTLIFSHMVRRENDRRLELEAAHEQLRILSARAEAAAAAEERARLAREIHDGVAHHLTSANILVAAGAAQLPADTPAPARDSLLKAQSQIRSALAEIRASIAERQADARPAPLPERLARLIQDGNFPATLTLTGSARRLAPAAEHAFYRVAQEALTNASKHAPGAAVTLMLDFTAPNQVALRAENPEPAHPAGGDGAFGLLSLHERMTRLGGSFTAGPESPGLFVVRAELPA